jgi:hypothetical protein
MRIDRNFLIYLFNSFKEIFERRSSKEANTQQSLRKFLDASENFLKVLEKLMPLNIAKIHEDSDTPVKFSNPLAHLISQKHLRINQGFIFLAYEIVCYFKNYAEVLYSFKISGETEFHEGWRNYLQEKTKSYDNNIKKYLRR